MIIRTHGRVAFGATDAAMRAFTAARDAATPDELWLCEHAPVFTQGLAGKAEHLLAPGDIPVVATNRGGQVTYHGPGQVVAYPLVDLGRAGLTVKTYVHRLEAAVLQVLDSYGVTGYRVAGAPGIYVDPGDPAANAVRPRGAGFDGLAKIAALGVKVSRGCTYHGVALNVAMDLEPFTRINPCGYAGLATVDLARLGVFTDWADAAQRLAARLQAQLSP